MHDSIGYTPGVTYTTYMQEKRYNSGTLNSMQRITKHVNTAGMPDTTYTVNYNTLDSITVSDRSRFELVFNSYNDPTIFNVLAEPATPQATFFFYYEPVPTYVNETIAIAGMQLYPNPTADDLYITISDAQNHASTTITIADITGRTVKSIPMNIAAGTTKHISLRELPQGINIVSLLQNGVIIAREKLSKK